MRGSNHSIQEILTSRQKAFSSFILLLVFIFPFTIRSFGQGSESLQSLLQTKSISNAPQPDSSGKSAFIPTFQEAVEKEYKRSLDKFENRKIYLKQHKLISNLKNENFKVKSLFNKSIEFSELKDKMTEYQRLIPVILDGIYENKVELQTERNLTVSAAIFKVMLDELVSEKEKMDEYANLFRQAQYRIDSISAEKDLYLFSSDSLGSRQYAYLLIQIAKEIKPANDSLNYYSGKVDSLQTSLNELVFDLKTQIESLELIRRDLNTSIFKKEIPEDPNSQYFTKNLSEAVSYSWTKEKLALFFYLKLNQSRLIFISTLIILIWIVVRTLKKRIEKSYTIDSPEDGKEILKLPILSAIVIGIGIFQFFFLNPPFIFYWIIWLIASISLTAIFAGYLSKFWMFFWVFTVLVFLLSGASNMILLPTVMERYLLMTLSIIGVCFLIFTPFKKNNDQLKEKRIVFFIYLMGAFELISLSLNLLGRFNLSKSFLVAGYIGIVLGILLLWTVRLINQGLAIATSIYQNHEKELFFINFNKLGNRAPGIFYTFLILGWVILVGKNFYRFSQISIAFNAFLNDERMVGAYTFSINGMFLFLIILIVSVMISRVLSIFSADPEASSGQRKRVSFGSWLLLVQIFVISMGLFLAFASSGIPLDKITIILGALSVGIGLGLQGLVNNLVSGLIIAFENTVKVGDLIEVDGKPGIMKSIGFRSSVLNMSEGSTAVIPNGELINRQLINWTTGKGRKLTVIIRVAYGTDLDKAIQLLQEIISEDSRIRMHPAPSVVPMDFADSSIDIEVTFWVKNYLDFSFAKGELLSKANEIFKKNQIRIPFPQRDLYLKTVPDNLKEVIPEKENDSESNQRINVAKKI